MFPLRSNSVATYFTAISLRSETMQAIGRQNSRNKRKLRCREIYLKRDKTSMPKAIF